MTEDDKALVERMRADDLCDLELAPIVADRIEALSAEVEQARMEERAAIVAWLKKEGGQCDCLARSEGECACGAWDNYKTVPVERIWNAIEVGEYLK